MVPKRKDEIPVLWDDLDFDEASTRLVLSENFAEKFSGVFKGAPRAEELSVADFETIRIPRREVNPGRAFERFLEEEYLETVCKPRPNFRGGTKVMPRAVPTPLRVVPAPPRAAPAFPRAVVPIRASPDVLVPRPIVAPTWGRAADPLGPTVAVTPPTRTGTRTKPRARRSLIPWAALLMGFVVGVGLFSDAAKTGHVQRFIDFVASFVDPAINGR
jgi:hypothetical protein